VATHTQLVTEHSKPRRRPPEASLDERPSPSSSTTPVLVLDLAYTGEVFSFPQLSPVLLHRRAHPGASAGARGAPPAEATRGGARATTPASAAPHTKAQRCSRLQVGALALGSSRDLAVTQRLGGWISSCPFSRSGLLLD
jgi:hypothetical protein